MSDLLTARRRARGRVNANRGLAGRMEATPKMDMAVQEKGSLWHRLRSTAGFTATADYFVMDWASVWTDIALGLLIAGALAAWLPNSLWQSLFFSHDHTLAKFWGPVIGPAA